MFCSSCGKDNPAAGPSCNFCGASMVAATPGGGTAAIPSAAKPAAAAATDAGKKAVSFVSALNLADKFALAGPVIAFIGFFLPFVTMPDLGALAGISAADLAAAAAATGQAAPDLRPPSLSLFGLAKYSGSVYFILLAVLVSGALFYLSLKAPRGRKLLISGFQVMIGSMIGPGTLLALIFASIVRSMAGFGFWVVSLGFCCIVIGGLMTIARFAKSEA